MPPREHVFICRSCAPSDGGTLVSAEGMRFLKAIGDGRSRRARRAAARHGLRATARDGAPAPHQPASREGAQVRAGIARDTTSPLSRMVTLQQLIFKLSEFWSSRGCLLQQPLDVEMGAGTMHPETFLRVLGPAALERGLRAAVAAPCRWSVRRKPQPAVQAPPVSGDSQAGTGRSAAALSAEPRGMRHRSPRARHPIRRGQLGVADARRLGHRLAGALRRSGNHAVHLLPAGWRNRSVADFGGADLRDRASGAWRCRMSTTCSIWSGRPA